MPDRHLSLNMSHAEDTARLAAKIGAELTAGDVILLTGDVGAGKTHFARALILSRLSAYEDVPSPTFTLVQTYQSDTAEIWHADLYRLTTTSEIEELGLLDAFETAICLIEWPDRLGNLTPADALSIILEQGETEDARTLTLTWKDARWDTALKKVRP